MYSKDIFAGPQNFEWPFWWFGIVLCVCACVHAILSYTSVLTHLSAVITHDTQSETNKTLLHEQQHKGKEIKKTEVVIRFLAGSIF